MQLNPKLGRKKPTRKSLVADKKPSDTLAANQTFLEEKITSSLIIISIDRGMDACSIVIGWEKM